MKDGRQWQHAEEELARSEARYRRLVECLNDGVGMVDAHGTVIYANASLAEMLGYTVDELLGCTVRDFVDEQDRRRLAAELGRWREGSLGRRYELDLCRKDGTPVPVRISARPLLDMAGRYEGSLAVVSDLTEQKQVERSLREANLQLQAIFHAYPDLMFRLGPDGTVLDVRKGPVTRLYQPPGGILGGKVQDNVPPALHDRMAAAVAEVGRTGRVVTVEYSLPVAGREEELEGRFCPLPDGQILLLVRNITARKRTERALAASEARYRSLVESINEGIGIMDENGVVTYANPCFCRMLGFSKEELENHPADHFYDEESRQRFLATRADRRRGIPGTYELTLLTKGGRPVPVLISEQPVFDDTGTYRGSVGVITEITELKRAQEELRQANAELEAMFDAYPDMSFRLAADGTVLDFRAGPAARAQMFLSPSEFIGKRGWEVLPSPGGERLREAFFEALETESMVTIEYPLKLPRGDVVREARLSPLPGKQILVVVRDITERKRAEEKLNALSLQLLRAQEDERQRLAHELHDEFGQLLAVAKRAAYELEAKLAAADADLGETAGRLRRDIERAIAAVRTIQRGLYPTVLEHLGLCDALEMLVEEFQERTGIACVLDMDAESFDLDMERGRALYRIVQEALTNVMRHSGASQVEIDLRRNGGRLVIEIRDDGRGIRPTEIEAHDAYGLMGMRKRAELCGGSLRVHGKPGEGTMIGVDIPLSPGEGISARRQVVLPQARRE